MEDKFKVGDVVQLKSGGHQMTISSKSVSKDEVWVMFFDQNKNELRNMVVPVAVLKSSPVS